MRHTQTTMPFKLYTLKCNSTRGLAMVEARQERISDRGAHEVKVVKKGDGPACQSAPQRPPLRSAETTRTQEW